MQFEDGESLALSAAERIVTVAKQSIEARGRFTLALSGGSTPRRVYILLADPAFGARVDWKNTLLFFGDERYVPHDDPASNYAMVAATLMTTGLVPDRNIFPIETHFDDIDDGATAYEETLTDQFGGDTPRFDLMLMGLGDDGHTASLFPGMPSLHVTDRWAVGTPPGTLPPAVSRVTLTFPVINESREILFLVATEAKAAIVKAILESPPSIDTHPSSGVKPRDGELVWMLDAGAAKLLDTTTLTRPL